MSAATTVPPRAKVPFDYDAWTKLHADLGKPDYTPDFNAAIEKGLTVKKTALVEKLYALIKYQATGNQHGFAVHTEMRTKPFTEADCARRLGVTRDAINQAARVLDEERFQLRREGGRLYPVPDPVAEQKRREQDAVIHGDDSSSINLRLLRQQFKNRFSIEFEERAEVRREAWRTVDAVNREEQKYCDQKLKEYLAAHAQPSPTGSQNGSDTGWTDGFEAEGRGGHENGDGEDNFDDPLPTAEGPNLTVFSDDPKAMEESTSSSSFSSVIGEALGKYGTTDDDVVAMLVNGCRKQAPDCTAEEVCYFIGEKAKLINRQTTSPLGFLVRAVPKCFVGESFREYRVKRQRAETAERERQARCEAQLLERQEERTEAAPPSEAPPPAPLSPERKAHLEKQIAEIKAWLEQNADGNEIGLRMYRRDLRRCERELAGERKPAESESHAKSKKAGQA